MGLVSLDGLGLCQILIFLFPIAVEPTSLEPASSSPRGQNRVAFADDADWMP
jgi:hypothetical protein